MYFWLKILKIYGEIKIDKDNLRSLHSVVKMVLRCNQYTKHSLLNCLNNIIIILNSCLEYNAMKAKLLQ